MYNTSNYLRQVGISENQFERLLSTLEKQIEKDLQKNPMKRRGCRSKRNITTSTKLLLTLSYLRHYPTFITLGSMFNITESYANKIYHKTINYMIEFIHPQNTNNLSLDDVKTVIVDVAEQPIERPIRKQKSYYSGKKKDIP